MGLIHKIQIQQARKIPVKIAFTGISLVHTFQKIR